MTRSGLRTAEQKERIREQNRKRYVQKKNPHTVLTGEGSQFAHDIKTRERRYDDKNECEDLYLAVQHLRSGGWTVPRGKRRKEILSEEDPENLSVADATWKEFNDRCRKLGWKSRKPRVDNQLYPSEIRRLNEPAGLRDRMMRERERLAREHVERAMICDPDGYDDVCRSGSSSDAVRFLFPDEIDDEFRL